MKKIRMYVSPQFKWRIEKLKVETEEKENRNISVPEFTKKLDVSFSCIDTKIKYKKNVKKIPY